MPDRISPLAKKLGIKKSTRALIVNAPSGYIDLLSPLPEGSVISQNMKRSYAFVQFFASQKSEIVNSLPALLKRAGEDAIVWIAYPKQSSQSETDLNRDRVRETVAQFGWRTVSIISIDPVWSALRIRPKQD